MCNHIITPESLDGETITSIVASSTREHKQLFIVNQFKAVGPNKELITKTYFKLEHKKQIVWIGDYIRLALNKYNQIHSSTISKPIEV